MSGETGLAARGAGRMMGVNRIKGGNRKMGAETTSRLSISPESALSPLHDRLLYFGALILLLFSVNQRAYAPKQGIHTVVHISPADVLIWVIGLLLVLPVFETNRCGRIFTALFSLVLLAVSLVLSHCGHAFVSVLHHGRHSGQFKSALMSGGALVLAGWQTCRLYLRWRHRNQTDTMESGGGPVLPEVVTPRMNHVEVEGNCRLDAAVRRHSEPRSDLPLSKPRLVALPRLPIEVWALLIVSLLSGLTMVLPSESLHDLLHSPDSRDAVRKAALFLIELFQHLGIALFLFLLTLRSPGRVRLAVRLLVLAAAIGAAMALFQYLHHASPVNVKGFMQSRKAYGGLLCMVLPLLLGSLLGARRRVIQVIYALVIALMLATIMSGGAFFCSVVGLVITALSGRGASRWKAAAVCAGAALLIPIALPRNRQSDVSEFLRFRYRPAVAADSSASAAASGAPTPAVGIKKEYVEWIAGIYMMSEHFWLGVGPGQYQLNIGQYYGQDPNPAERLEPDSNNLYFVYAASLGFAGLVALCQVLLGGLRRSWRAVRAPLAPQPAAGSNGHHTRIWWQSGEGSALAAGTFGALAAFTLVNIFTNLFVRGAGIDFAFLLALSILATANVEMPQTKDLEVEALPSTLFPRHETG